MPDVKIGDRTLAARTVRPLSDSEWQQARDHAQPGEGDALYFQVERAIYEAIFAPETSLNAAIHAAIKANKLTVEFDGRSGTFLKSEDVGDRLWF